MTTMKRAAQLCFLAGLAQACEQPAGPTTRAAATAPAGDAALARRVDAAIDGAIAGQGVVGAVVLIARDGEVIYHRAAGLADREARRPMREDTIFRLASMTKPIVSAAALALVDQGALRLDDPVTRWLPEFRPRLAGGRQPVITVRHLITHTSGLSYSFLEPAGGPYHEAGVSDGLAEPGMSFEENARRIASAPLLFEPGTRWHYGLSVDLLGGVVARAGGATLPEVVRRTVTGPLGLTDTRFTVPGRDRDRLAAPYADGKPPARMTEPHAMPFFEGKIAFAPSRILDPTSYPSGGAGMAGTPRDYLRFTEAIRTGGAPILKPETARAMTQSQTGGLRVIEGPGWGFGLGVGVMVDPVAAGKPLGPGTWSWGGVYGTYFWVDPEARLTVIIMTNSAGEGLMSFPSAVEKAVYGP